MEDIDDDFGDIYADVEVQATPAVNGVSDFTRLYIEPEDDDNTNDNSSERACPVKGSIDSGLKNANSTGDESAWSGGNGPSQRASDLEADGSDSEDDLNIVLNDDDCQIYPIKGSVNGRNGGVVGGSDDEDGDGDFVVGLEQGSAIHSGERGNGVKGSYHSQYSQYKYIRPHAAAYSSIAKANGSAGVASFSLMLARGDCEDNSCNQHKGSSSGQVAPPCSAGIPGVGQNGRGFSLPSYRTILDVNIDTFEQKPWRHPGVDITDFFNFGFDEESWKNYCNSLEQIRQRTSLRTRIPVYESTKSNQAYESGFENEKVAQEPMAGEIAQPGPGSSPASKYADGGPRQWGLPKGRAIQVEDSTCERLPSIDVRRPRNRDSDVVIQITVQDSKEQSPGSCEGEGGHIDSTVHEPSKNGDFGVDDNMDNQCFGSANGDELSIESLDKNAGRLDRSSAIRKCSKLATTSKLMARDSVNNGNDQISDVEGHHHEKKNVHTSNGNDEVVETLNKTKEWVGRNTCDTDPCIMETESSLGDEIQHSRSSSHLGSQSEASEHGVYIDPENIQNSKSRPSSNSVTEFQDSVTSGYYLTEDFKSPDVKKKSGDNKDSTRNKSSILGERKRCGRRLHHVAESKIHTDNYDASPMSDMERLYDRDHSSVGYRRQKETLHNMGSYDREDILKHQETEAAHHYCGERFADNHNQTAYTKNFHRKSRQSFRDKTDPYFRRKWDERECFLEERITRVDRKIMESDWYHHERGLTVDDMGPHTYRQQIISKHCSYTDKERDTRWKRKRDYLQFRKRTDDDDRFFESKHADDFMQEKYGRYVPFTDRERYLLDEKYERHLPFTGREDFGRRERCGSISSLDLDDSVSMGIEDEYLQHTDHRSLSSQSYRESYTLHGERWHDMSPRNDVYDSRLTERCRKHGRQLRSENFRDGGWLGRHNDAYEDEASISYPEDQGHLGKRRYGWQSNVLHWTEDELIYRHQDDELYAEEAPLYYERISRHENIHAKHGSIYGGKLIDDKKLDWHRYKMTREESSRNFIIRSSNIVRRGKLEQTVFRCRNTVDLVVGEGKPSGRCFKAETVTCNGNIENLNNKNDREQTIKDFNKSHTGKAVKADMTEIESNQNGEKWLDKFPVTEHSEALDIEEGQIVTEEPDKGVIFEKRHASEIAALTNGLKKKALHNESAANRNKVVGGIDNLRILETIAKMEKRRERFKEPLNVKKEPDKSPQPQDEPLVETAGNRRRRPARKRQWGGG